MLNLSVKITEATKTIQVFMPDRELASINCDGDINFSPLIESLTTLLDGNDSIEVTSVTETQDPKLDIAVKILKLIFDKFNLAQAPATPDYTQS